MLKLNTVKQEHIVIYYYNYKIEYILKCNSGYAKLNFQLHYSSLQCRMIL